MNKHTHTEIKIEELEKKSLTEIQFILDIREERLDTKESVKIRNRAFAFYKKESDPMKCKFYEESYCFRFKRKTSLLKCKSCSINSARPHWPTINGIMQESAELNEQFVKTQRKIKDYFKAVLPILVAKVSGKTIPLPQIEKRMEICSECENITLNQQNEPMCGICTCHLSVKNGAIPDIITLEETALQGCKHRDGSKWKKGNV